MLSQPLKPLKNTIPHHSSDVMNTPRMVGLSELSKPSKVYLPSFYSPPFANSSDVINVVRFSEQAFLKPLFYLITSPFTLQLKSKN